MKTVEHILEKKGRDVWSVHPDDSVFYALQKMAKKNIGALAVIEDDKLAGIFSEREYARKVALLGRTSPKTSVREIMETHVVCARPEQLIEECMAVMTAKCVRHLPVLHDNKLVGIVSLGDVVKSIIEDQEFALEELYHYFYDDIERKNVQIMKENMPHYKS